MEKAYELDPRKRYDGPNFAEYCISEASYIPATRDRTACVCCPLSELCQAGFDEQVRRILAGENPSLTDDLTIGPEDLTRDLLMRGLTSEQQTFVAEKIPF